MSIAEQLLKIIVGGDGGIGKTSILRKFCRDYFNDDEEMTMGSDFFIKRMAVNGEFVNLQIWDLAGQERFRFFLSDLTKGSVGAVIGFDVKRRESFADLDDWITLVREYNPAIPIVLVGLKIDLNYHPAISPEKARKFVEERKLLGYVETSSKAGLNVDAPFEMIVSHLMS